MDNKPQLIDTHAHLNFRAFKDDSVDVINKCLENNTWMILPGSQKDTSTRAIEIAKNYETGVYATIGLHPLQLLDGYFDDEIQIKTRSEDYDGDYYRSLAEQKSVVGIGECGIDFYYAGEYVKKCGGVKEEVIKKQEKVYRQQIDLALSVNKPLICHCRPSTNNDTDAYDYLLKILQEYPHARGVLHGFRSNIDIAQRVVAMGWYLGINGMITFVKDANFVNAVKEMPLDRILLETDAPYITPVPLRGHRNEPMNVRYVAEKIAEIKGISFDEVAKQTSENARKLFGI